MSAFGRTRAVALDDTTAIYVNHLKYATPTEFATDSDWTPAAGDVKVSKDGGAAANIATLPVYVANKGWKYVLSGGASGEIDAKQIVIRIADAATKAICDDQINIETFGTSDAMLPAYTASNPMPSDAVKISGSATAADNLEEHVAGATLLPVNLTEINGATTPVTNLEDDYDGTGYAKTNSTTGLIDNAITAAKIAADAGAELADAVWDEALAGHATAGSAGAAATTAAGNVPPTAAAVADAVWDEAMSGHTTTGTFGAGAQHESDTAQGGTSNTITLATTAIAADDAYNGNLVVITAGTGAGQIREITDYAWAGRVATVDPAWTTVPDATSEYVILRNVRNV